MQSIRCRCGKIVCQVTNLPETAIMDGSPQQLENPACLIMCRHCKRYVVVQFSRLTAISVISDTNELAVGPIAVN